VSLVLLSANISKSFKQKLSDQGYEFFIIDNASQISNDHFQATVGIVTSNKLILNKDTLTKFPQLKWIARLGSGMEIIDTSYCNLHGIRYYSSPNGIANSVAEHTMGMILGLLHHIPSSMYEIKHRQWIREPNRGIELESLKVGIIGYGHTGSALAKKLSVFTPSIMAYDKYKSGFGNEIVKEVTLEEIKQEADIISFHVPLNNDTLHYYDNAFLESIHKNHYLINTSRGAIIDTSVIVDGLKKGKIIGACLDVLQEEKNIQEVLSSEHNPITQLLQYNVTVTPHIAGYSIHAIEKMSEELMNQLF
jgi:D-3-phosphoglycerate dehydrogenase